MSEIVTVALIISGIHLSTPILLPMLGGLISERSGVINIGLEGQMLFGAFSGVLGAYLTGSALAGVAVAIVVGVLSGLCFALLVVYLHADQVVAATAMNLVGAGLTAALVPVVWGTDGVSPQVAQIEPIAIPVFRELPWAGSVFERLTALDYAALLLAALVWWILFKTHAGLQLRACGESPEAADAAGVNVLRTRTVTLLFSGGLAALGGASLSLATVGLFQASMSQGRGFLALAALLFGKWRVWPAAIACLLLGVLEALQLRLQIQGWGVPTEFLIALPYILAVVVLATLIGRATAPAAVGRAFVRS